jgi:hypothetical protein
LARVGHDDNEGKDAKWHPLLRLALLVVHRPVGPEDDGRARQAYDGDGVVRMSHEHSAVGLFDVAEIDGLPMPEGYRRSIRDWRQRTSQPA